MGAESGSTLRALPAFPANGGILWGSVLANFQPGPQETWVDYHNDGPGTPLLFVSGSEDYIMPPAIQRSNLKHYKSNSGHRASASTTATPTCCRRRRVGRRSPTRCSPGPWSTLPVILTHSAGPRSSSSWTAGGCSPTRP